MNTRRWGVALLAVVLVAVCAASPNHVFAQQPQVDKKVIKAQQEEGRAMLAIGDAAAAGQAVPADFSIGFSNDFLKAQDSRMYVPFTLSIPTEPAPPAGLTMYLRVTAKGQAPAAAAAVPADKKKKDDKARTGPEFAFEDVYPVDLKAPEAGQPYRFSRAFTVPAGEFEVMVVLKERAPIEKDKKVKNPVYKAAVLKQALNVPDYWNNQLATSSIILASDVTPLTAPLTPQEVKEQPYTLGTTRITPSYTGKLAKKGEFSVVFIVYNTQVDASKKPDVSVDYSFYRKVKEEATGEKFFNKTNPQNFNASTLPPQFDPSLGHQLVAGQSVPLGSFPEGEYRLEVKVTDKLAGKTVTQNVPFFVVP